MFKRCSMLLMFILILGLVACSNGEDTDNEADKDISSHDVTEENADKEDMQKINHLDKEYEVPKNTERIVVVGAMEALEDSMVLGVHPVGATTIGGEYPDVFKDITQDAKPIGEKTEPNLDEILQLEPDVILASTKFPDETKDKLKKLAPVVDISHISSDGIDNLNALAAITGKKEEAEKAIEEYDEKLNKTKEELEAIKDENILAIRVRGGELYVYPDDVYLNLAIYHELGFPIPDVVDKAEAQEAISLEQLAEVDPDVVFLQNAEAENDEQALKDVEDNPIWQSLSAVKEDKVYVNSIDPILEGGPIYSRGLLLDALTEHLGE